MADDGQASGVAGTLVDALARGGELVDEGGFTLDPRQALAKLREHQLAEPIAYVLLLVEAAHLASRGRGRISFELGATTTVEFGSVVLDDAHLRNPLAAAFASLEGRTGMAEVVARVARLLALAANAALAAGAKRVEIANTSADGQPRAVVLDARGEPEFTTDGPQFKRRLLRFRFEGSARLRADRERELLWAHCQLANLPIFVDGERFNEGRSAAFGGLGGAKKTITVALDGRRIGDAGLLSTTESARVDLLTRSVLAETIPLPKLRPGFVAIVDVDLRKDLSQRKVVRDAAFDAVLDAVARAHDQIPAPRREPDPPARDDGTPTWLLVVVVALLVPLMLLLIALR